MTGTIPQQGRLRPRDMPTLRADLVAAFDHTAARMDRVLAGALERGVSGAPAVRTRRVRENAAAWSQAVAVGALWWVAPEMTDVAATAARTVPDGEISLLHEHADPSGVIFWAGSTGLTLPWTDAPAEHQTTTAFGTRVLPDLPVVAMAWRTVGTQVWVSPLTDDARALRASSGPVARTGIVEIEVEPEAIQSHHSRQADMLLRATHALALQPGLGERRLETTPGTGRGTTRRREPQQVTVVSLRRPAPPPGQDSVIAASARQYTHQWVVGGHWRRQAVGTKHSERRLTWIAPHIKGPDDKPLILKDHVKVWKR